MAYPLDGAPMGGKRDTNVARPNRQSNRQPTQTGAAPLSLPEQLLAQIGGNNPTGYGQLLSLAGSLIPGGQYLPLVASLGFNIFDAFTESEEEKELQAIFQSKKQRLLDLRRQARGEFTPAEEQRFRRANAPVNERVAANLAQRGLAQSGIIAETLAGLEQSQYYRAQDRADAQIPQLENEVYSIAQEMRNEPGFGEIATGIMQFFAYNQQRGQRNAADARYETAISQLETAVGELENFDINDILSE